MNAFIQSASVHYQLRIHVNKGCRNSCLLCVGIVLMMP